MPEVSGQADLLFAVLLPPPALCPEASTSLEHGSSSPEERGWLCSAPATFRHRNKQQAPSVGAVHLGS